MRLAGKTACLLFLFILIFPLHADPADEDAAQGSAVQDAADELPPVSGIFFFEELFVFEEAFSFDSSLIPPEPDETAQMQEEIIAEDEIPSGEENLLSEELFSDEEPLTDEESLLADEDALIAGGVNTVPAQPEEDDFLDDDAFFFEAPPLIFEAPTFQIRSIDEIFPKISPYLRTLSMSNDGIRHSFVKDESPVLVPNPDLEIDLLGRVMAKKPSHLIEAMVIIPYNGRELDLLDIYNALGRIGNIKDYPAVLNGNDFYVFTESSRIESARSRKDISDPSPAITLPFSETMYLRLKEVNYGNLFIRGDVSISMYGITYSMTNFTDVRYFLVPVIRAERFVTIIYLEPVKEGMLIYSMTGFYLPGFIADRVNLTPNINRRIKIFTNWIADGLRAREE